jgi:hypothetical protein
MMRKILIVFGLFMVLSLFAEEKKENSAPNPLKELFTWTYEQNVGLTCLYDLDKSKSYAGAKWEFFKTKHDWLRAGLCAGGLGDDEQILGIEISFNLGKAIEKIKGSPMVYLKHLEIGYYIATNLDNHEAQDGFIINAIKINF